MNDRKNKNIYLKNIGLFFLSWIFLGMSYLAMIFETDFVSFPLITALIALIIALFSFILAVFRIFKYKSITPNLIIVSVSVSTTVIIFIFLKFYYFFLGVTD